MGCSDSTNYTDRTIFYLAAVLAIAHSPLALGLGGGSIGGSVGSFLATAGCTFVLGVTTGPGALACAVLVGAMGSVVGGNIGAEGGEVIGEYLYRRVAE